MIDLPLVFFVFIGDRYGLRTEDVEEALLGYYYADSTFTKADVVTLQEDNPSSVHGLFLRKILELPHPKNLSAVVACDWFDSPKREKPGKCLYCLIIHYWDAIRELPVSAFGNFPQIVWSHRGPENWAWRSTTDECVIARLPSTGGIEFSLKEW